VFNQLSIRTNWNPKTNERKEQTNSRPRQNLAQIPLDDKDFVLKTAKRANFSSKIEKIGSKWWDDLSKNLRDSRGRNNCWDFTQKWRKCGRKKFLKGKIGENRGRKYGKEGKVGKVG